MIKHNFRYEWMQLSRDRWVVTLLVLFVALSLFASQNGKRKVDLRAQEISTSLNLMNEGDAANLAMIDSLDRGLKKNISPWLNPKTLSFVGNRAPRVVAMPPAPLALVATGQSDLYSHVVKPTLSAEAYLLSFTELSNPVQLLFGSFDLAFVFIYLLPLLVLAFSYNMLSAEKEQGSLRLTIAQPVSLYQWLLSKTLLRFLIMTAIVWIALAVSLTVAGTSFAENAGVLLRLLVMVTAYILFWFLVALIINSMGHSSGANVVSIISVWVVLVLLLPSIIAQLGNSLYPIPSRINMINEMRAAKAEADRQADSILDGFLRDHPELATQDKSSDNQYTYYLKYFASQDVVRNAIRPVLDEYQIKLKQQQNWAHTLRFLSPSLILQSELNDIAGTSSAHYEAYRNDVIDFAEAWRNYFMPRMFANESMRKEDFALLPAFTFNYEKSGTLAASNLFAMLLFLIALGGLSTWAYRKERHERILAV